MLPNCKGPPALPPRAKKVTNSGRSLGEKWLIGLNTQNRAGAGRSGMSVKNRRATAGDDRYRSPFTGVVWMPGET